MKLEMTPVRRREAWIITGIAALYLLIWIFLPKPSFWGLDSGIKYQGMTYFSEHGRLDMPYAGVKYNLPPEDRSIPAPFSIYRDNTQIPVFSTIFMVMGGVLMRLFGTWGPFMLPLFGGWGVLYAAWMLWIKQREAHDGAGYLFLVGLGTPVLFYSLELWEHTIATALVTLAIANLPFRRENTNRRDQHKGLLFTGMLLALAALFRSEAAAIFAIILVFWRLTNRSSHSAIRFLFGGLMVAIPGMAINYWLTGEVYPLHMVSNIIFRPPSSVFALIAGRAQNVYALLIEGFERNILSVVGLIPLITLTLWRSWRSERGWWPYIFTALIGVGAFYLWMSFTAPNRIGYTAVSGGLFWVTPFLTLAVVPLKGERRKFWQLSWVICALFVLIVAAFFPSVKGVHWGPRAILVVLPLALLIAVTRAQRWWEHYESARPIIGLLFCASIIAQVYSVGLLSSQRIENTALNKWIVSANSDPVLTNLWWTPGDCALASYGQPWFYTGHTPQIGSAIDSLRKAGVTKISFIEMNPYRPPEVWIRFGARKVSEEYFPRGKRDLRRIVLDVSATEGVPSLIEAQDRTLVK